MKRTSSQSASSDQHQQQPSKSSNNGKIPRSAPNVPPLTKRLLKDLHELQCAQLDTVYAEPIEGDLRKWFITLLAPATSLYHGIIMHLEMNFPDAYPRQPPTITPHTRIHHSHVFSEYICLDMLNTSHHHNDRYSGWSSSYSVLSILLQLQSFLLEEEEEQYQYIERDIKDSRLYRNRGFSDKRHDPYNGKIWPCAPHWNVNEILGLSTPKSTTVVTNTTTTTTTANNNSSSSSSSSCNSVTSSTGGRQIVVENHLLDLPDEMLIAIFEFLTTIELKKGVEKVSSRMRKLVSSIQLSVARELICFYSKATFEEDYLGIGLEIPLVTNYHKIQMTTPLDLISRKSFYEEGVRDGVWNEKFNFWFPLYINKFHGNIQLLKESIDRISNSFPGWLAPVQVSYTAAEGDFPLMALNLLCKLMNNMIVEIMKGYNHASIAAVKGYCHFHRWMIYLADHYPKLNILHRVQSFISDPNMRNKRACPNLGELLPLLSVLGPNGINWDSIKKEIVDETSVRNAFWITKQFGGLANLYDGNDIARVKESWKASQVSCRLIMFHVYFLRNIVEKHKGHSLQTIGRLYDVNYGSPDAKVGRTLQREIFKILRVSGMTEFFKYVGIEKLDTIPAAATYLRECMRKSHQLGYTK